jgi:hypothetical protein
MLTFIQSTENTESSTSVYTIFNDFLAHNLENATTKFQVHIIHTRRKQCTTTRSTENFASYQRGVY